MCSLSTCVDLRLSLFHISVSFRTEGPPDQSKKALKKQQKEAEKAAKKAAYRQQNQAQQQQQQQQVSLVCFSGLVPLVLVAVLINYGATTIHSSWLVGSCEKKEKKSLEFSVFSSCSIWVIHTNSRNNSSTGCVMTSSTVTIQS